MPHSDSRYYPGPTGQVKAAAKPLKQHAADLQDVDDLISVLTNHVSQVDFSQPPQIKKQFIFLPSGLPKESEILLSCSPRVLSLAWRDVGRDGHRFLRAIRRKTCVLRCCEFTSGLGFVPRL